MDFGSIAYFSAATGSRALCNLFQKFDGYYTPYCSRCLGGMNGKLRRKASGSNHSISMWQASLVQALGLALGSRSGCVLAGAAG